jgi:peptide deformylase
VQNSRLLVTIKTMAVHTILKMGDARLLRTAQPVTVFDTDALHLLVSDMLDTMEAANGAGLAAPQIGVDLQLVIFGSGAVNPRYPDAAVVPRTVLINPLITPLDAHGQPLAGVVYGQLAAKPFAQQTAVPHSALDDGWEGCLSVPGFRGAVQRFTRIRYQGFDQYGDPIDRIAEGFHARVVQHECDHLLGVLYPMRVDDFSQFGFTEVLFPQLAGVDDD